MNSGQNKLLLFREKSWEAQRDALYQEYEQLKGQHEQQKKKWCEGITGKRSLQGTCLEVVPESIPILTRH